MVYDDRYVVYGIHPLFFQMNPATSFRESIFIVPLRLLVVTEISQRNDEQSRVGRKVPFFLSNMAIVVTNDALSLKAASSKVK